MTSETKKQVAESNKNAKVTTKNQWDEILRNQDILIYCNVLLKLLRISFAADVRTLWRRLPSSTEMFHKRHLHSPVWEKIIHARKYTSTCLVE